MQWFLRAIPAVEQVAADARTMVLGRGPRGSREERVRELLRKEKVSVSLLDFVNTRFCSKAAAVCEIHEKLKEICER